MPRPLHRTPPVDPFDHSHCYHPRPRWVLQVSEKVQLDLFQILHELWKNLIWGNVPAAVSVIEQLNYYLIHGALNLGDQLDADIDAEMSAVEDLQTLNDPKLFDSALRALFEGTDDNATGTDGGPEQSDLPSEGPVSDDEQ